MADFTRRDLVKVLTGALDVQFKRIERTFATKEDLSSMEVRMNKQFATKEDLRRFATKDDLNRFATKIELTQMEHNITTAVNQSQDEYVRRPEHTKLEGRVATLERKIN